MGEPISIDLLREPTDRDKQRRIGPSQAGDMCNKCVADALRGTPEGSNTYWLGAVIGTGIHSVIEQNARRRGDTALIEHRLTVGELEGYGPIKGTLDRFDIEDKRLTDFKSTLRKKRAGLEKGYDNPTPVEGETLTQRDARYKLKGYYNQMSLYGLGLENEGYEVETLRNEFIPRDGTNETDIWYFEWPYDPKYARRVWARLEYIWKNLDNEEFESNVLCWRCTMGG